MTTTEIKRLKPYMYQLIPFKIILHLYLLVKLSMQDVFVSPKFKNYGWRVLRDIYYFHGLEDTSCPFKHT